MSQGRILAIDYGKKRCGLAWTDPLQLIATALKTIPHSELRPYLKELFEQEAIPTVVLGYPTRWDGSDTDITEEVRAFQRWLVQEFPELEVCLWDERFTSRRSMQTLIASGVKKKKRRNKGLLDQISATLILQEYLANS